jgi:hypothetical protein
MEGYGLTRSIYEIVPANRNPEALRSDLTL